MPLPAPLPPWAKAALYLAPFAFQAGQSLFEYLQAEADAEQLAWLHVQCHAWRSTPTGTAEDKAQIGFDIVKLSGGANDPTWDQAQVDGAVDEIVSLLGNLAQSQDNNCAWNEIRSYVRRFDNDGPGFAPSGDPVDVRAVSIVGAGSTEPVLPYQVACSVTEKTTMRKHWGRFYVPCIKSSLVDGFGRWTEATCTAIASTVGSSYADLANANYAVVVPSGGTRTLFTVTQVQVDDIPDVIRSRRPRDTLVRAVVPV